MGPPAGPSANDSLDAALLVGCGVLAPGPRSWTCSATAWYRVQASAQASDQLSRARQAVAQLSLPAYTRGPSKEQPSSHAWRRPGSSAFSRRAVQGMAQASVGTEFAVRPERSGASPAGRQRDPGIVTNERLRAGINNVRRESWTYRMGRGATPQHQAWRRKGLHASNVMDDIMLMTCVAARVCTQAMSSAAKVAAEGWPTRDITDTEATHQRQVGLLRRTQFGAEAAETSLLARNWWVLAT